MYTRGQGASVVELLPIEGATQNNSITDPTIQSLAAHVWHDNPELVRVLIEVGQYAGLAPSRMTRGVPRIEDVVVRTNNAFGPLLCTIP